MAMPTSAVTNAGASMTPSPTMATRFPRRCSSWIFAAFSSGSTWAITLSMPNSRATASATALASPVSIATSMPSACRRRIASAGS
jgi:hypothetical protein